uniref:Transposase n=1 Tax=Ascaris lumbricoides TaxID=6252 RepID=A0A0M3IGK0_ASCLU
MWCRYSASNCLQDRRGVGVTPTLGFDIQRRDHREIGIRSQHFRNGRFPYLLVEWAVEATSDSSPKTADFYAW